jgi:hypothetical protein
MISFFEATYDHTLGKNCDKCDSEHEIKREEREVIDPEIHYGLIASGHTLVKNAIARDTILRELEDKRICLEMEAAGLINTFPCLVVRGICDYANSHKNDRWQRYAKDFLGIIPGEDIVAESFYLNPCFLTEVELRRLYRRFGYLSVEKLRQVLENSGHDIDKDIPRYSYSLLHILPEARQITRQISLYSPR